MRVLLRKKSGRRGAIGGCNAVEARGQVPAAVLPTAKSLTVFSLKPQSDRLLVRFLRRAEAEIAPDCRGGSRPASPLAKACHLQHPYCPIECQCQDVTDTYGVARRGYALAIEPNMPCFNKGSGIGARAHRSRMPQPFVDALAAFRHGA